MKSFATILLLVTLAAQVFGQAPGKSTGEQPAKNDSAVKKEAPEKDVAPEAFYKLAFNISEIEDGKRVNQREYSMVSRNNDGRPVSIKSTTRVPINAPEKQLQYLDAGLDIRCFAPREVAGVAGKVAANCDVVISNFVVPDQSTEARNGVGPVLRTTNTSAWAVVTLGKPTVMSIIDDVNSKKRIQIEVTATKID
jgi:hypothetical protein